MATSMKMNQLRRTKLAGTPKTVVLVAGGVSALVLAFGALTWHPVVVVMGLVALAVVLVGLRNPDWVVAILLAQYSFIPSSGEQLLFGNRVPDVLKIAVPAALLLALVACLRVRHLPRPLTTDFLIASLGLWGLIGIYQGYGSWVPAKYYGTNFLYPMLFYVMARLLVMDRTRIRKVIGTNLVCVAAMSALMIIQSRTGSSPLYHTPSMVAGMGAASGPFNMHWTAAAYLILWFPFFAYVIASAASHRVRAMGYVGLLLNAYAVTRTMERGQTVAMIVVMAFFLTNRRLRATAAKVLLIGAIAYVPWSMTSSGSKLLDRFEMEDQSRQAMRMTAIAVLRSPQWNPVFGVGFYRSSHVMRSVAGDPQLDTTMTIYGRTDRSVAAMAAEGFPLHNVFLALPVEFGLVGTLLVLAVMLTVVRSLVGAALTGKVSRDTDSALAAAIGGMLLAAGGVGYLQNLYVMVAPMSVVWFFCGVVVGQPARFACSNQSPLAGCGLPPAGESVAQESTGYPS